ncbi:hypothetical protein MLD38_029978 [Melastoma candidum]|uniref:Uncharacterized protein n=1 Tax=Melastoma candidum TaxID=119954 RepID=A0ACB9MLK0_9MYRT|nr:hypothetical protein MLD38_029978 [Melastoma candidum]
MSNPEYSSPKNHVQSTPGTAEPPQAGAVPMIIRRWRRDDLVRKGSLVLRGLAFMFSLLSFIIMASNKHGGWKDFDKYEEFRYLLAISILSTLYTGAQAFRHVHEISTGGLLFKQQVSALIDFAGDQIVAYLLASAASTAVPMTNRMSDNVENLFTQSLAASISMAFLTFIMLALSALISGYKLSTQSAYI